MNSNGASSQLLAAGNFSKDFHSALRIDELSEEKRRHLFTRLPKIELHRHLEGSLTPQVLSELAAKYPLHLPSTDPEILRPLIQITERDKTLLDFLKKFEILGGLFISPEIISDISYRVVRDAAAEGIRHLELRYSPSYMASTRGLSCHEVIEAVETGIAHARAHFPISVCSIIIIERQWPQKIGYEVLEASKGFLGKGVTGLDLANDELNFPPELFSELFQEAKRLGFRITVHAGEAGAAKNIWTAIEKLGAERIGHGVRAAEDPDLMKQLARSGICLEMCPTSNVQTGTVGSLEEHPILRFLEAGICVTINTDDPGVCGVSLVDEWMNVSNRHGLTLGQLRALTRNALRCSFISSVTREGLSRECETEIDRMPELWKEK